MSNLFAFNVSEFIQDTTIEGQYDPSAQLWTGDGSAVAANFGFECANSELVCERSRQDFIGFGCSVSIFCIINPFTGQYCFGYNCPH
ncbi:MAG: hypothetical protein GFH27_549291n220 [Chloroflexi bacterium AL-W]|nr:hypothetical protein [Chloroflexi bacterium AL-N1]NOK67312.1 hypothetical protein [Chloroflexi bacterium AL-N10]NOK75194.1 hypothetical protein [Chloroflexi bacterium AL-N5]NOK81982.1 hypothetical protein [Chloroflexi bacterium AL-W]NOK89827.1 hypothetical protein [Chloroflexi bacterium AL-N15]